MVGAITTLIVIVAVFLAYNANNGLPFVPVYRVSVDVPNAARLGKNNEVRIGGHRVGVVESIEPVQSTPTGGDTASGGGTDTASGPADTCCVAARLNLKLDQSSSPIPEDSIFRVRYRSSFGLKYLEIIRGTGQDAPEGFVFNGTDDGDTCKLPTDPQAFAANETASAKNGCFQPQTEFDAISDTFDTRTRTNARINLLEFGDAFAGRGGSLNEAISNLRPLLSGLKPVSKTLSDPNTELRRFVVSLADTARIVAPVATEQSEVFTNAANAFTAISANPEQNLKPTISNGPPVLENSLPDSQGTSVLQRQTKFLADFAELSRRLKPGVEQLRLALPDLNDAVRIGTPVLAETAATTNPDLRQVFVQLDRLVEQPSTKLSLERLKDTFDTAKPLAEYVTPAQTVCNYWNYWFTYLTEHITERDQVGFQQRIALVQTPIGGLAANLPLLGDVEIPGQVQTPVAGYSGLQANGKAGLAPNPNGPANSHNGLFAPHDLPILHGNPYAPAGQPFSADAGEAPDCQAGQTGYVLGNYPVPGQAPSNPAFGLSDIPGSRGLSTVYYNQDGTRELRNTTIPSHLP
jgi:ABC-type transporter Mla subunit MlaD